MLNIWEELRDPDCRDCGLYQDTKAVCLLGDPQKPKKGCLMGIGEAPGKREENIRRAFSGKAGSKLDGHLQSVDISRKDIYLTNVNKCRPKDNRTPTVKEMRACRPYLLEEIDLIKPSKIIAFGAHAVKAVVDDARFSLKKARGTVFHFPEFPEIPVYACYHPAAELYDPYVKNLIKEDLEFALGLREQTKVEKQYLLVNDVDEAWNYVEEIGRSRLASIDFETTGLDQFAPNFKILTMGLCTKSGKAISIPCGHPDSTIAKEDWLEMLEFLTCECPVLTLVGHNIKYDIKCAVRQGLKEWIGPIRDTMLEFHDLDENYPSKSLAVLKKKFFSDLGLLEDKISEYKGKLIKLPIEKVAAYNCEDVDACYRLARMFRPRLRDEGLMPLVDLQAEATKMLADVELTGVMIDYKLLQKNQRAFTDLLKQTEASFPGINLRSPKQLASYLYNQLGMRILEKTPTGEGSTKTEVLERLRGTVRGKNYRSSLEDIIRFKKLDHFDSHFLSGLEKHIKQDGKIHPRYNMAKYEDESKGKDVGTVTGRLSCVDPNLQQIPRDTEELEDIFGEKAIQIKEMFVSSFRRGWVTQVDYSQIELRLMAEYAQDEKMIKDFESGVDIHTAVTNHLIPIAPSFYSKYTDFNAKRKQTKAVNFGIIYLISEWSLAERLDISRRDAADLIRGWFRTYSKVKRWLVRRQKQVAKSKESISLIGRKRRLPAASFKTGIGREALRQGVNFPIQSLASDINIISMVKLWKIFHEKMMKSKIVGNIHDAVLVDTHPKEKEEVVRIIEDIFPQPDLSPFNVELTVPLEVEVKQGRAWSTKKEG